MKEIDWGTIDIKDLAQVVSAELNKHNISAVLVGGACVSIYSHNKYLSMVTLSQKQCQLKVES